MMRVVLTGGGTGGHVIPNLAVIEELKDRGGVEILYIGSKSGMEKKMVENAPPV
ncbi:MAG: UDP-N-acetylglucosamine--N-acetylmuramyl-(pentapeptide) pyrophosphoryl-undecaprenol N-acetylglucosamine transferase, partial [Nitrospirae bacterium]|nr:UDP-N-acetylglucosamine--N-acetylmuramyl-(pentapeptide) pyrophosphoryl-undecaprenol N-acetylglucosamine transferase [Nitrospirota bacterium]